MNFIEIKDEKSIKKLLRTVNQKFDLNYQNDEHNLWYRRTLTTDNYTSANLCILSSGYQLNLHAYYTEHGKMDVCKGDAIIKTEDVSLSEKDILDDAYQFISDNWEDIFENELEKVRDSINHILSTKQNFVN